MRGVNVLQGVSLRVEPSEIVCLIGPNGAGKSTVLRAISGLLIPRRGRSCSTAKTSPGCGRTGCCGKGIAQVPQGHSAFPGMTIHENLLMGAYTLRDRVERERRLGQRV